MRKSDALSCFLIFRRFWCLPGVWTPVRYFTDPDCPAWEGGAWIQFPEPPLVTQSQRLRSNRCLLWALSGSPTGSHLPPCFFRFPQLCQLQRPWVLPKATQSVPSLQLLVLCAQADSITAPSCFPNIPERSFPVFFFLF